MSVRTSRAPARTVRVARLLTTPVKGLRIGERAEIELRESGARGDRTFVISDPSGGLIQVTRHGALLRASAEHDEETGVLRLHGPDGELLAAGPTSDGPPLQVRSTTRAFTGTVVTGPWTAVLSTLVGREACLVRAPAGNAGFDVRPVTLVGSASIAALAADAGRPVDPRRFRMLVELEGAAAFAEDGWDGARVRVGEAELRVRGPVPRCAATTRDPEGGERDLPTVRILRERRGLVPTEAGRGVPFGVYAEVLVPGRVRLGDELVHLGPAAGGS